MGKRSLSCTYFITLVTIIIYIVAFLFIVISLIALTRDHFNKLLTHLVLRDELDHEAHVVERTFVRIVRDDSRRVRREFRGHRRRKSVAFPKMRHPSAVDDRHLEIHLPL